jgi:hypothetical protein
MGIGRPQEIHGQGAHNVRRKGEQLMLKDFITIKHTFAGRSDSGQEPAPQVIDLPEGIGLVDIPERNIMNGQLYITW